MRALSTLFVVLNVGLTFAHAPTAASAEPSRAPSNAPASTPQKPPPLRALRDCVLASATPEDQRLAFRTYATESMVRDDATQDLAALTPAQRDAQVAALARTVERIAGGPCRDPVAAMEPRVPEAVPFLVLVPLIESYGQREQSGQRAMEIWKRIGAAFEPTFAQGIVKPAPSAPPAPATPPQPATYTADDGRPVVNARFAQGIQIASLCPYPPASRRQFEKGVIVLVFRVDKEGYVDETRVITSTGYPRLDKMTIACMSGAIFEPTLVDGKPVESWQRIRWNWKLED